jgi:glycosyltransferase domain-containing protein
MSSRLTILMPLKGRPLFTLRFLWYANASRMPYHFLLADGQVRPALARVLDNAKSIFPNLDLEYVKYPDDADFGRYFAKLYDAVSRAPTPYVMLADNDDFLMPAGIQKSLSFLDDRPDYVSCGGGIAGFAVPWGKDEPNPGLVGPFNNFRFRYAAEDRSQDFGQESVTQRLLAGAQYSWGYYAIYRREVLTQIERESVEVNFSDVMLHEWFADLRALTMGKARSDPSVIGYLREYWTSMRTSFSDDWVHHLLRSRFTANFSEMIDRLSKAAADADGGDAAEIAERVRQTFDAWYRGFLRHNYGPSGMIRKVLRDNVPDVLLWLKRRRRYSVPLERRNLFKQLSNNGASGEYLDQFRRELAGVEDTLTGKAFAAFLQPFLSVQGLGRD